jgi:hypothetical protein
MATKSGKDLALSMLRVLPRVSLANIRDQNARKKKVTPQATGNLSTNELYNYGKRGREWEGGIM